MSLAVAYEQVHADPPNAAVLKTSDQSPRQRHTAGKGDTPTLQRKATDAAVTDSTAPPIVGSVIRCSGRPLDEPLRRSLEDQVNCDLSTVRLHTDSKAAESAQSVNSLAYTVGRHIVFGRGHYHPHTSEGRQLLVHELTHVRQQSRASTSGIDPIPILTDPQAERVADHAATAATAHDVSDASSSATPPPLAHAALQRKERNKTSQEFPWKGQIANAWSVALRRTPSKSPDTPNDNTIADLPRGTIITVIQRSGGWLNVSVNVNGRTMSGFVSGELVQAISNTATEPQKPTWGEVQSALSKNAEFTGLIVEEHPMYIESAVKWVGIRGMGGPFLLANTTQSQGPDAPVVLPREFASTGEDPLARGANHLNIVYKARTDALAALSISRELDPTTHFDVAYYVGPGGYILPTVISLTTAPRVMDAMQKLLAQEQADAAALGQLAEDLLWWYVGARFPLRVKSPSTGAVVGVAETLQQFSATERVIIGEARTILQSKQFTTLRAAFESGKATTVRIGGRVVQFEPNLPASGMTIFSENGFLIGREAFASDAELAKTVLHELYRLTMSEVKVVGGTAAGVADETAAAFEFAERAYKVLF